MAQYTTEPHSQSLHHSVCGDPELQSSSSGEAGVHILSSLAYWYQQQIPLYCHLPVPPPHEKSQTDHPDTSDHQ